MHKTRPHVKAQLIHEIREYAFAQWPVVQTMTGSCVYWAAASFAVFTRFGVKCVPQAGSMSWPIIRKEDDDGICNTHFSYKWEGLTKQNICKLSIGLLPEMHVWVALPDTNELVDMSVGQFPEEAKRAGEEWKTERPPMYFWETHLPEGVVYEPKLDATMLAAQMILNLLTGFEGVGCTTTQQGRIT